MPHLWTPIAAPALRRAGIKYVPVIHDARPHPGDPSFLWDWRMRTDLNAACAAIALTNSVAATLRAEHPRLTVMQMPLGAHLPPGLLSSGGKRPRSEAVTFLSFGRIQPYKGIDLLRDAFKAVIKEYPLARLKVVGEGDVERVAPGIRSIPGVEVRTGWISEAEIPAVFSVADVAVLSHREASQSGIAPLALAYGIPIIATAVGGIPEQVRDGINGILVRPDASAIANGMRLCLNDDIRTRLTQGAAQAARDVADWTALSSRLVHHLRSAGV
jgi:glycosyltransferase involved in cell wall biosynthesis